jgi:hypothetical protein
MGMSPEEIVSEWSHLTLGDVYAALAYYDDNRQRIDAEMKAEEEQATEFCHIGPRTLDGYARPAAWSINLTIRFRLRQDHHHSQIEVSPCR